MSLAPYWQSEEHGLRIYCGDCLEVLPALAEVGEEFDLCLTDPPFELTFTALSHDTPAFVQLRELGWQASFGWVEQVAELLRRGSAWYVWMNDEGWSPLKAAALDSGWRPCQRLIVIKTNPQPTYMCKNYRCATELVMYGTVGDTTNCFNMHDQQDALPLFYAPICGGNERTEHPTQKPLSIVERMVRISSNESDSVLDPFAGVGTTLVAAYRLGRHATGIEISEEYCELAAKRLEAELAQGRLFEPQEVAQPTQEAFALEEALAE
jgi:site-specific DNA-methyltransferase (adenine-specific)